MDSVRQFFRTMIGKFTGGYGYGESDLPKHTFYDTIEEFGYHFNEKEELVDENGDRFKFFVKENDRNYNQQHYDALGELITEFLYTKMETDLQLQKVFIPLGARKEEPQGFIFQSPDAGQCETLMVIVNGGGVVRAGQWSRKLIINEGLESGSQFPYIRRAREAGFGVVVLNTNQNQQMVNGKAADIGGSGSAEDHGQYVWEHIISKTKAANIIIVAHSYGGLVTCTMAEKFLEEFKQRVFCVVFTDSVHTVERERWAQPVKDFLKERAVNFASTYVPLGYMMEASAHSDCLSVSAGTEDHERTSHACIDSAFSLIHDNLTSWTADGSMAPRHFKPLPDDLSQFSCATRWQRKMEKVEGERESSSSGDAAKPAASPPETEKRRAADVEEGEEAAESVSENGGSNQGEKKAYSKKDEEAHSPAKNGERRPDGDSGKGEEEAAMSKNGSKQEKEKNNQEPSCEQETAVAPGLVTVDEGEAPGLAMVDEGEAPGLVTVDAENADNTEHQHGKEGEEETAQVQQMKGSEQREEVDSKQREEVDSEKREEADSKVEEVDSEKREEVDSEKREEVDSEKREEVDSKQREEADSKVEEVDSEKREEVDSEKREEVDSKQREEVDSKQREEVDSKVEEVDSEKREVDSKQREEVDSKVEEVDSEKREEVDSEKREEVDSEKREEVDSEKREEVDSKVEEVDGKQREEVDGKQREEVDSKQREEVESKQREEVDSKQRDEVDSKQRDEVNSKQREEVDSKVEEVDHKQREEVDSKQREEVDSKQREEVDSKQREEVDSKVEEADSKQREEVDRKQREEVETETGVSERKTGEAGTDSGKGGAVGETAEGKEEVAE